MAKKISDCDLTEQVQGAYERDPMRPQLDSPEEYCRLNFDLGELLAATREVLAEAQRLGMRWLPGWD